MTKHSLPVKRLDGSVFIEPLHPTPARPSSARLPRRRRNIGFNNIEVQRGKIVRDIAILVLLAITIIAGSAAIVGLIWRDVAVAESQAPIVEAEQAAQVRLAETELQAAADERFEQEVLPMVLAGFGIAITALVLARPRVMIGR